MARVKLKDVVMRVKDKVDKDNTELEFYVGGEHIDGNEICVTKKGIIQGSTIGPAFHMAFKAGDVLLMSRNPHLRKASMVDFDGICSDVSYVCRTKDEGVLLQSYLPFLLQSDDFWRFAEENKKGGLPFFLNWSDFERYEFELPSIEKQRELSDLLWAMQRTKQAYQELLVKTDELVKSQFIEMFGDCIINDKNWDCRELQDVLAEGCRVTYGIVKTLDDVPGGVPVFRPVDISQGHIPTRSELKRTSPEISSQYKRTVLQGNELLITIRGSVGETFQTTQEFEGCNVARNIVPLRANSDILLQGFLKAVIDSESFQDKIASITKGVALQGININEFKMCPKILPPIQLQTEWVEFAQQTDKSKFELKQNIENINSLMRSLMRQDFTN